MDTTILYRDLMALIRSLGSAGGLNVSLLSTDVIQYSYAGVMYFVLGVYLLYSVMYSLCVPRARKKIFHYSRSHEYA